DHIGLAVGGGVGLQVGIVRRLAERIDRVLDQSTEARPAGYLARALGQARRIGQLGETGVGIGGNARCGHRRSPDQDLRISIVRWIMRREAPMTLMLASWERWASRRSVISTSELTFGYLTLPLASAAGWPGSCLTRKSDGSVLTRPSATVCGSIARASAERDVLRLDRAVEFGTERRDFAAIRFGSRLGRRRIGVGDVLGDDPHAAGL